MQDERRTPTKRGGTARSADRRLLECLDQLALGIVTVPRGATVEDQRLPKLHSNLNVRLKVCDLISERRVIAFCINPRLSDRHDLGLSGTRQKRGPLTRLVCGVMRMDPDRRIHPVVLTRDLHRTLRTRNAP